MELQVNNTSHSVWGDQDRRQYSSNLGHHEVKYEKATYKSYKYVVASPTFRPKLMLSRKKYRKIRHAFNQTMTASTNLFINEQNAIRIARRLQEQNEWVSIDLVPICELNV